MYNQTAVIEHVIALYFRVLRGFGRLSSTRYHRLLQAVLQNLGKCVSCGACAWSCAACVAWCGCQVFLLLNTTHGQRVASCVRGCVLVWVGRGVAWRGVVWAGRVAHVIDVKVALEVMAIFRTMITDGDMPGTADSGGSRLPLATVVHVVLAAVAVLHGPGGELLRDEDDGYLVDAVCAALPQLVLPMNQHRDVVAAVIKCTEVGGTCWMHVACCMHQV